MEFSENEIRLLHEALEMYSRHKIYNAAPAAVVDIQATVESILSKIPEYENPERTKAFQNGENWDLRNAPYWVRACILMTREKTQGKIDPMWSPLFENFNRRSQLYKETFIECSEPEDREKIKKALNETKLIVKWELLR